jgi:hypothetical protein
LLLFIPSFPFPSPDPAEAAKLSVEDWKADEARKKEELRVRDENLEKHAREQEALCDQYHRTRHRNAPDCGKCGAKGGNLGISVTQKGGMEEMREGG